MKFHALAGYLLALFLAGFFLWLLRAFVRWLRRDAMDPEESAGTWAPSSPGGEGDEAPEKVPVNWTAHLFLSRSDDLEHPARLEALTPSGAFLRCSARLRIGQGVTLYIDVPGGEPCRVSAKILWIGEGHGRSPLVQVRFEGLPAGERQWLWKAAQLR